MDIVIEIQGFRNMDKKFIPKKVSVVAINATIIGHWSHFAHLVIYPKELDEKTTSFRGIIMALSSSTVKPI